MSKIKLVLSSVLLVAACAPSINPQMKAATEALLAKAPVKSADDHLSEDALAHYDAGTEAFERGENEAAFQALRRAEGLEPFSAKIQFLLGRVLEKQERVIQCSPLACLHHAVL